jgi:omega-6 fatty acid desaturase (delta-12 desaturase)
MSRGAVFLPRSLRAARQLFEAQVIARSSNDDTLPVRPSPLAWRQLLVPYSRPHLRKAAVELLATAVPLLACAIGLFYGLQHDWWSALLFALPAALFVVRLFIIQHDCGHGSYFKSSRLNDSLGRLLSVVTLMPYWSWRRDHAVHHATSGDLDNRGTGDLTTLTVGEYLGRSWWGKLLYRAYRHPLVLLVVGPVYVLLVRYRFPLGSRLRDRNAWLSIIGTNVAAGAVAAALAIVIGPAPFLIGWTTVVLLATSIGVWFFYVQHQFEDTYWRRAPLWDFHTAAFAGSSFYDLPGPLHWLTGWIGFHHIHHLASKIPSYRLRACFEQNRELQSATRLTLWTSIKAFRLVLWDEERRKLVTFRQALGSDQAAPRR